MFYSSVQPHYISEELLPREVLSLAKAAELMWAQGVSALVGYIYRLVHSALITQSGEQRMLPTGTASLLGLYWVIIQKLDVTVWGEPDLLREACHGPQDGPPPCHEHFLLLPLNSSKTTAIRSAALKHFGLRILYTLKNYSRPSKSLYLLFGYIGQYLSCPIFIMSGIKTKKSVNIYKT